MTVRIGLFAAGGDDGYVQDAVDFLLVDAAVQRAICLGDDPTLAQAASCALPGGTDTAHADDTFLARALRVAPKGTSDEIMRLLKEDSFARRLQFVDRLTPDKPRLLEVVGRWVLTAVTDKALLDEEDIFNASVIAYGVGDEPLIKGFGPRCFVSPGPPEAGHVAVIELEDVTEALSVTLYEIDGAPGTRYVLDGGPARISVRT